MKSPASRILAFLILLPCACFGDSISGIAAFTLRNGQISLTTPQGYGVAGSWYTNPTMTINPQTGEFFIWFAVSTGPQDRCMGPTTWQYCRSADLEGTITGTLTALPVYKSTLGIWVVPNQNITIHGVGDVGYSYTTQDLQYYWGVVQDERIQFLLAFEGMFFTDGLRPETGLQVQASFPDPAPVPEPSSIFLMLSGGIGLVNWMRLRNG